MRMPVANTKPSSYHISNKSKQKKYLIHVQLITVLPSSTLLGKRHQVYNEDLDKTDVLESSLKV